MMNYTRLTLIVLSLILSGCAGTIITTNNMNFEPHTYSQAFIVATENSQYIKFKFGTITPFGYIPPADDPAQSHNAIGNTDQVICNELEKYGIKATIGKKGDVPGDIDLIVEYNDTWRWDFKPILDRLEIIFNSPDGKKIITKSVYNIYRNKELHNFPTPEKEVPKMIRELLTK
jgi:hypothetical protein